MKWKGKDRRSEPSLADVVAIIFGVIGLMLTFTHWSDHWATAGLVLFALAVVWFALSPVE
jgi:hypothetical protein